jgi:hypothetical protein
LRPATARAASLDGHRLRVASVHRVEAKQVCKVLDVDQVVDGHQLEGRLVGHRLQEGAPDPSQAVDGDSGPHLALGAAASPDLRSPIRRRMGFMRRRCTLRRTARSAPVRALSMAASREAFPSLEHRGRKADQDDLDSAHLIDAAPGPVHVVHADADALDGRPQTCRASCPTFVGCTPGRPGELDSQDANVRGNQRCSSAPGGALGRSGQPTLGRCPLLAVRPARPCAPSFSSVHGFANLPWWTGSALYVPPLSTSDYAGCGLMTRRTKRPPPGNARRTILYDGDRATSC